MKFTHLHVHSVWSLLSGVPTVQQLVERAKAQGLSSLALTDTNRTSGLILFYEACRQAGIKPLLGVELSEADSLSETIVLLARNATGYGDLCELASQRMLHPKTFSFAKALETPRPDLFFLSNHPRCLAVLARTPNAATTFGELINQDQVSRERSREVERFCHREGLRLVATNNSHFLDAKDWPLHQMLRAIDLNSTLSRLREGETVSRKAWLCDENRMRELFPSHGEAIENSGWIADQCNVELDLGLVRFTPGGVHSVYTRQVEAGKIADSA